MQSHNNKIIDGLQELREIAVYQANKCRWDPALSIAHEQYVEMLDKILQHA